MAVYYILPVILLVAVVVFSRVMSKRAIASVQSMTPEQSRERINQYFAGSFKLNPGETLYSCWIGEEYMGEQGAGRQLAGAALNQLSSAAVGVSKYVPQLHIGLTSEGRVLVAREYSEMGDRGNFKQVAALAPGTRVVPAATAYPGQEPQPPLQSPLAGGGKLEFYQFRSPTGERYDAWLQPGQWTGEGFIAAFEQIRATLPAAAS